MAMVIYFCFKNNFFCRFSVFSSTLERIVLLNMASKVGYDVDPIEMFGGRYKCQICLLTYRDPVQLSECGHRFCKICINDYVKK